MRPDRGIVTRLPLDALWNERGPVAARRVRHLGPETLRSLLRASEVRFVVADIGAALRWIPQAQTYAFWKAEVGSHLVDDPNRPFDPARFPQGYCYLASEWRGAELDFAAVILERHH